MMSQNDLMDSIDRYLTDEMNEQERLAFEKAMHADIQLAEEVRSQKVIKDLVFDRGILNLKEKLEEVENLEKARVRRNFRWFLYAVIGMVVFTGIWLLINRNENDRKVINVEDAGREEVYTTKKENNNLEVKEGEVKVGNNVNKSGEAILKVSSDTIAEKLKIMETSSHRLSQKDSIGETTVVKIIENDFTNIDNQNELFQNNHKHNIVMVDCNSIYLTADVTTQKTCMGQKEGKVIVDITSVKGGTAPYTFSISGNTDYSSNGTFTDLAEGNYKVYIKDKNGCPGSIENIYVGTENCVKNHNYSISPDYGDEWKIPMEESLDGVLTIWDQAGREVYKLEFNNGIPDAWNGTSASGKILTKGAYYYELRYDTGNTMTGYISIIR